MEDKEQPEEEFKQEISPESPSQTLPQYNASPVRPQRKSPKKFLYLLAGVLIILVLFNAVRILTSKGEKAAPTPAPVVGETSVTPSPSLTEEPQPEPATPTPKPSADPIDKATGLDRSKLTILVQNGSGETGVGGKAADILKSLGYTISSTGNADNFDYKNVTVKVKSSQKDFLPLLVKDLNANYLVSDSSSDLSATASADALVIVGK